jgi:hypothetical protein
MSKAKTQTALDTTQSTPEAPKSGGTPRPKPGTSTGNTSAPRPLVTIGSSDYQLAAERAILANKDLSSAGKAAAVAVLETLLNNAQQVVAFLQTALANAKSGTGQDGGNPTLDNPFVGPRAK